MKTEGVGLNLGLEEPFVEENRVHEVRRSLLSLCVVGLLFVAKELFGGQRCFQMQLGLIGPMTDWHRLQKDL